MARSKKPAKPKITAGHVEQALRLHLNWQVNKLIPEANIPYCKKVYSSYRADYISISGSGYATEYEVKVSMSDWKADLKKGKWGNMPSWINKFIYVVPEHLGVPDWVPAEAGIWHLCLVPARHSKKATLRIKVVRPPKRLGKDKVPFDIYDKWMSNFYYRYWNARNTRDKLLPAL